MNSMFSNCESLKSLPANIANWNTKNVTDMGYMFYACKNLIEIKDLEKWNTTNVTNIEGMFVGCEELKHIPYKFEKGR